MNNNILVLKKDKGRDAVIRNCKKYLDNRYTVLDSNQFTKLDQDPACYMENKVQRTSRKIKSTMPQNLSGWYPAKFYVAAKMHKFSTNNDES